MARNQRRLLVQAALLGGAGVLGYVLFSAPTVVVSEKERQLAEAQSQQEVAATPQAMPSDHEVDRDPQVDRRIRRWRSEFEALADRPEKRAIFADSLGEVYRHLTVFDSAFHFLDERARIDPSLVNLERASEAAFRWYRTTAEPKQRRKAGLLARERLENYLKRDSGNLDAEARLGAVLVELESPPMGGIRRIRAVLARDPEHRESLQLLGEFAIQSGQLDKAQGYFERLLAIDPDDLSALLYLGECLAAQGQKEKARGLWERARERSEDPFLDALLEDRLGELKN